VYDQSIDEKACFEESLDHDMPSGFSCYAQKPPQRIPANDWRGDHSSIYKIAPKVQLAQFQAQIVASDKRGPLPYRTEDDILRRRDHRAPTAVKLDEQIRLAERSIELKK
jgi:hypothetical protein